MLRYVRSGSVVSRVIAGETLIVPVRQGVGDLASIFSLNEVATAVWSAISEPRSRAEIITSVQGAYENVPAQVESDIDAFLEELSSAGLVETLGDVAA